MSADVDEEKAGAKSGGAQVLSSESTMCDPRCLSAQSLGSYGMVLLVVVVLVAEGALAMLALRPEVSACDDNTGMDSERCADVSEGHDGGQLLNYTDGP